MAEIRGGYIKASYVASGNLDNEPQYRFVRQGASNTSQGNLDVFYPATSGAVVLGVIQNKPRNNEFATLVTLGHTKIMVANSLGSDIPVMTGNSGFAVRATSGQYACGFMRTGATSGAVAEMVFSPFWLTASL